MWNMIEDTVTRLGGHGHLDHSLMQLTCAFKTCLNFDSGMPFPFDNVMLLHMPKFMSWKVIYHLICNRQTSLHGNLVTHD